MRQPRTAFTLIEMLVAMALTMFVMVILSQAFVAGLTTFSGLKGIGDLQASLRVAQTNLQADLSHDHFEFHRKLSDLNIASSRPREGYVFIRQGTPLNTNVPGNFPYQLEGKDADGLLSVRSVNHVLACTIRLRGNRREHYMLSRDLPMYQQPTPPPTPPRRRWSPLSLGHPAYATKSAYFWGQERDGLFNPGEPTMLYTGDDKLPLDPTTKDTFASGRKSRTSCYAPELPSNRRTLLPRTRLKPINKAAAWRFMAYIARNTSWSPTTRKRTVRTARARTRPRDSPRQTVRC
jgi:type II secretory pathway pseudopilin PulG